MTPGYAGTQKCLGVAPGLAPFTINDAALGRILAEGLPRVWGRHAEAGALLQDGLRLLERHGIEIGPGAGRYAASVWRIGLMGHNARPDVALGVLAALADVLGRR